MAVTVTQSMLATRPTAPRQSMMTPPDGAGDVSRATVIGRDTERPR
jgi:hypothetical protein